MPQMPMASNNMAMGQPPVDAPQAPTLSGMRTSQGPQADPGAGVAGALPKLFFQTLRTLDVIAAVLPDQSQSLDAIKTALQTVLTKTISRGGQDQGMMGGAPPQAGAPGQTGAAGPIPAFGP